MKTHENCSCALPLVTVFPSDMNAAWVILRRGNHGDRWGRGWEMTRRWAVIYCPSTPDTGRGSGWFLRWGVSWGASADIVAAAAGAWRGQDLKGIATFMEQEIENLQLQSRVYNPQLCQSLGAGGRQRREWLQRCRKTGSVHEEGPMRILFALFYVILWSCAWGR